LANKPWREIAKPHKDVLEGTFKQSEFAADISQVAKGDATSDYQDPEKFFARTYITEGMGLLLTSVVERLASQGGDPVIQLQTAFGGGKTHTMLAVYHLASHNTSIDKLAGIPEIFEKRGIKKLPKTNIAVIDGNQYAPSKPVKYDSQKINTLWGILAWQLLGQVGYDKVAKSDQDGTSPGKKILIELIQEASPCVILIDELVAFIRQFADGKTYNAGTFDSNLSFIQALTESIKSIPNAILLASLPESDMEAGGEIGQRALVSLEKYFGRVESVWKPVGAEEAFEIVRRRLFDSIDDNKSKIKNISKAFANFYREHSDKFPPETQTSIYEERLYLSYPIHPEIFDRLYEDWSTLEKFQKTRGVLQYMAVVIHHLWNTNNRDLMIMPGSIPLDDGTVRNKSIHYLPNGWEPVIEKEIDGPKSRPAEIDGHDTRFGSLQAARRTARTIFLGSAPSSPEQTIRGIRYDYILLGTVQPGETVGVFEDVLKRLKDNLHHLFSKEDHFWFETKPNLRREMQSRKLNIDDKGDVMPLLKGHVKKIFGKKHFFAGIHFFPSSSDVPDDWGKGPRLVVIAPNTSYSQADDNLAVKNAKEILTQRGEQSREKQNRLIFLAADSDSVKLLFDYAKTYLAWSSILDDFKSDRLDYQKSQFAEVEREVQQTEGTLKHMVRESYKWILCPMQDDANDDIKWENTQVSPAAANIVEAIEDKLKEEEWVISSWSPIHLKKILNDWYFKEDREFEIGARQVFQDSCCYLYLPRLLNSDVLKEAISSGVVSEDFFAYASGKEGDKYLGFIFGSNTNVNIDESSLLIEQKKAITYKASLSESTDKPQQPDPEIGLQATTEVDPTISTPATKSTRNHFYGTIKLKPVNSKIEFSHIVDEVVEQFTSKVGVDVAITVEIEAKSKKGFDESVQRSVKENCKTLKFKNSEFEEE